MFRGVITKESLVFGVVFLGFYLNAKERKIREKVSRPILANHF